MGNRDIDLEITGTNDGLDGALTGAKAAVKGAVANMEAAFGGLQSALNKVNSIMVGFTAALAGGAAFKAAVDSTVNLSKESIALGRNLGIGASQASVLQVALGDVYATADQVTAATGKIAQTLNKDEQAFTRLGVATRDSNGQFRNSLDILLDVNTKLAGLKEGTDRNVAGVQIFGKSWNSIEPLIRLNAKAMDEAASKARELGLVVGQEDVEATTKYRAALNDADDVMQALKKTIGDALLPTLTETAQWFSDIGPAAVHAFRVAIAAVSEAIIVVKATFVGVATAVASIAAQLESVFMALGRTISRALHGDIAGAKAAWADGMAALDAIAAAADESRVAREEETARRVAAAWDRARNPKSTPVEAPKDGDYTTETKEDSKGRGTAWQTGLDEAKAAWSEQRRLEGSFQEFSKAQEVAYWQDILATQRTSRQEQLSIRSKIAVLQLAIDKDRFTAEIENLKSEEAAYRQNGEARLAIAQQIAERMRAAYGEDSKEYAAARKDVIAAERQVTEQLLAQQQIRTQSARDSVLAVIGAEETAARERTTLNLATAEELLAQEEDFENRRYQVKLQAAQEAKQLAMDGDQNPVEVAKRQAELEELEREHQARLRQIRSRQLLESRKEWLGAMNQMEGGFKQAIAGMMKGQLTFAQGIKEMTASVVGAVIDMMAQIAAQWLIQQVAQIIGVKTTAASTIAAKASEAGAAGVASFAGAPWPINMGAPAFGVAMAAAAASFSAGLSAAGGFDVPAGVNPVTQLHQREMVLPAAIADPLREMVGSGSRRGGMNVHIHANDSRGFERMLQANGRALAAVMERHYRRRFNR